MRRFNSHKTVVAAASMVNLKPSNRQFPSGSLVSSPANGHPHRISGFVLSKSNPWNSNSRDEPEARGEGTPVPCPLDIF